MENLSRLNYIGFIRKSVLYSTLEDLKSLARSKGGYSRQTLQADRMSLVQYSSSDDSETEESTPKREATEQCKGNLSTVNSNASLKLPVPNDIHCLFTGKKATLLDDPTKHEGRIRSFPHEEGNWATSVFIPTDFADDEDFIKLQEQLFDCLHPFEFNKMIDFHISLSKTVVIRHHWIQEIRNSLEKGFVGYLACACEIDGVKVFVNDEKTRSFLGLQVTATDERLQDYVKIVDDCFEGYKLDKYYKPPSFHISIGWCLGDISSKVTRKIEEKMREVLHVCLTELEHGGYFSVNTVVLKTGNKEFAFKLSERT